MINGQKIVVVMPAYNAEHTLEKTYSEIPFGVVDEVILTDDCSRDATVDTARRLGIEHFLILER
ncbi:MAG: glycosyltransferase, partial [Alistipes sp.]|nr:glycosyltransferase [Alistipes sp.]